MKFRKIAAGLYSFLVYFMAIKSQISRTEPQADRWPMHTHIFIQLPMSDSRLWFASVIIETIWILCNIKYSTHKIFHLVKITDTDVYKKYKMDQWKWLNAIASACVCETKSEWSCESHKSTLAVSLSSIYGRLHLKYYRTAQWNRRDVYVVGSPIILP